MSEAVCGAAQPRAVGSAMLSTKCSDDQTRLDGLRQSGALKLLFPRSSDPLEAILINSSGGLTGGDRLTVSATAGPGSSLSLTTQAAERAYLSSERSTARVETQLRVETDASLMWLPQELILYEGCALSRVLQVELAANAQFLMVEPVIFGRSAMGERLRSIRFRDKISITREGKPIFLDALRLEGSAEELLQQEAIGAGAGAMALVVLARPEAAASLDSIRAILPRSSGASALSPDLVAIRLLASDGFALRQSLLPVLDLLTDNRLPVSWRL